MMDRHQEQKTAIKGAAVVMPAAARGTAHPESYSPAPEKLKRYPGLRGTTEAQQDRNTQNKDVAQ